MAYSHTLPTPPAATPTAATPPLRTHTNPGPLSPFPCCLSRDQEILLWWPISRSDRDKGQSVMGRQRPSATSPFSGPCVCVFVFFWVPLGTELHLLLAVNCGALEWLGTGRGHGDVQPLVARLCGGGPAVCSPDRCS